ncbi:hypothetical protein ILYODFUR_008981, partial [Ilyodon furcidens]
MRTAFLFWLVEGTGRAHICLNRLPDKERVFTAEADAAPAVRQVNSFSLNRTEEGHIRTVLGPVSVWFSFSSETRTDRNIVSVPSPHDGTSRLKRSVVSSEQSCIILGRRPAPLSRSVTQTNKPRLAKIDDDTLVSDQDKLADQQPGPASTLHQTTVAAAKAYRMEKLVAYMCQGYLTKWVFQFHQEVLQFHQEVLRFHQRVLFSWELMGYQRSMWRSLAGGGGGGVAVVRCSCSEEKVRISFRSAGDDRQLRRAFVRRWFESPRLSIASFSSDERTPSATPSDSSDLTLAGQRPVSLISTVSSGSGSSREDYLAPTRVSEGSSSINLNQNLSPENKGRSFIHNKNSNNKVWTPIRALSRREQASPFIAATMAPNPQLTYLDRVIMEIIETERMYVRDLRMIVDDYLAHIIDESDLSNHPELVCALFGNIEDIYEFN